MSGELHAPATLFPGKERLVSIKWGLVGSQVQSSTAVLAPASSQTAIPEVSSL